MKSKKRTAKICKLFESNCVDFLMRSRSWPNIYTLSRDWTFIYQIHSMSREQILIYRSMHRNRKSRWKPLTDIFPCMLQYVAMVLSWYLCRCSHLQKFGIGNGRSASSSDMHTAYIEQNQTILKKRSNSSLLYVHFHFHTLIICISRVAIYMQLDMEEVLRWRCKVQRQVCIFVRCFFGGISLQRVHGRRSTTRRIWKVLEHFSYSAQSIENIPLWAYFVDLCDRRMAQYFTAEEIEPAKWL